MRAVTWHGKNDVRVDTHPDPEIQEPTDIIIKVTSTDRTSISTADSCRK